MTLAEELASFVVNSSYEDLSSQTLNELKIRIADSIGCAIGALGSPPIELVRAQIEDFDGKAHCTLIGGGQTAPDRAAFYNSALVRFLDFNDSYLAKHETCVIQATILGRFLPQRSTRTVTAVIWLLR